MEENNLIGEMQWAIVCPERGIVQVKQIPIPQPGPGQVLIKVYACPINPSDLFFMKGEYDQFDLFKIHYPSSPGWEGSGIVVKNGGGIMGWRAIGKRVSFTRAIHGQNEFLTGGCYQQYCIANALTLNILPDEMPLDIASMHFVNPLTALGLFERINTLKAKAAIQTGAASQLGIMLINLCKSKNIPLINIVRREEQVENLKQQHQCEYVLNSNSENFFEEFTELSKQLKATALIECVGGSLTGKLIECLPGRSTVVFYGALSEKGPSEIDPLKFIGRSYKLEAFILGNYLMSKGISIGSVISKCNDLMRNKTLHSKIQCKFPLSQFQQNVEQYYKNMSSGKFLLCPNDPDENLNENSKFEPFSIKHLSTE